VTAPAYSPWRAELLDSLGPWAMAGIAGLLLAGLSLRRVAMPVAPRCARPLGNHGTSELEFAMAFPVFLVSVLTTVQMALTINALLVVDYAAYCAARSAIVWIPQALPGEPAHAVDAGQSRSSEKWSRVRRAATLAVTPIAPRLSRFRFGLSIPASGGVDGRGLARLAQAADASLSGRVDYVRMGAAIADKWLYANWFTDVRLEDRAGRLQSRFESGSTVTARVTHKFELAVPFASQAIGAAFGSRYLPLIGGYYLPLTAAYTLRMAPS